MRIQIAVPEAHVDPPVIDAALEAVTRLDESLIRSGKSPTSHELLAAGARWRPENMGDEHFDHGQTIAARGWGDCDDWAPLHAATLRASGEDPGATAVVYPSGPNTYHAVVRRSDGAIDDPSVAAGMKASRIGEIADDRISVYACDPHDGRLYYGQLAPSVAPLSPHCGPGLAVRHAHVVGRGEVYEGRCDVPIAGSPLLHARAPWRDRARGAGTCLVDCALPYALSVTARHATPIGALNAAVVGAILCGDAAEMNTSLDRYKMLAIQSALAGHTPGEVREQLVAQLTRDMHEKAAATGTPPIVHTTALLQQIAQEQHEPPHAVVGDLFSDIGHIASSVVSSVSHVASKILNVVPWGDILHGAEAAVSAVPGIGTAVSDVLATAESAYDAAAAALSGNPLEGAIHAAYNYALASVPGASVLHLVLDPVLTTILGIVAHKEPPTDAVLNGILSDLPSKPSFGSINPQSIAASLVHLIVGHLGVKRTAARPPARAVQAAAAAHAAQHRAAPHHVPVHLRLPPAHHAPARRAPVRMRLPPAPRHAPVAKPPGVPHAAIHVSHARAVSAPPRRRPGSPGAPPGATHWLCTPMPGGQWQCRWA